MSKDSLLDLTFSAGIDQSQRPEVLDPRAGFVELENGRRPQQGGYEKRYGFSALTALGAGYKLIPDSKRIAASDGVSLQQYVGGTWVSAGRLPECGMTTITLPTVGTACTVEDTEICNGYLAVAWRVTAQLTGGVTNTYVVTAVANASTGAIVLPPTIAPSYDASTIPQLAKISDRYLVLLSSVSGSATVDLYSIDTNTVAGVQAGWVSLKQVATTFGDSFLTSMVALTDRVAVAFTNTNGSTARITLATVTVPGASLATQAVTTANAAINTLDVAGQQSDTLWVAWSTNAAATQVKVEGHNPTTISSVTATALTILTNGTGVTFTKMNIVESATAGKGVVMATSYAASLNPSLVHLAGWKTVAGAAAVDIATYSFGGVHFASKPLRIGSRYYCVFQGPEAAQKNAVLCDFTDTLTTSNQLRPVANFCDMGLAVKSLYAKGKVATAADGTTRYFGLGITSSAVADSTAVKVLDFADTQRWKPTNHYGTTYLTGALTTYLDGTRIVEAGFLSRPRKPTWSTGSTGITATTGWRYVAIYEELDARGRWCVSGISDPSDSTGAVANKTVTVVTDQLVMTMRGAAVGSTSLRLAIYRTLDGAEPPYYRVGVVDGAISSTGGVQYFDTTSDAVLATSSKLYAPDLPGAYGEAQDRRAPPGLRHLVSYNGMLVGADDKSIRWSGQDVSGEATWWSPLFQIPFDDCTGLAVQDGTLFAFKRTEIYAISGEAPNDAGTTGGLGTPRRLAVDVGCVDGRSLAVTAYGIVFQSERWIELLSRAQAVEPIGQNVQDTLASYPVCTGVTVDSQQSVVYCEMAATETANQVSGGGRTLVFDLVLRTWISTDRRKNQAGTADTAAQSGALVWSGSAWRYAWLGTDGRVYVEDRTTHLDPGSTWVTLKATSSWLHAAGMHGEQSIDRVLFLADSHTGHDLTLSVYRDYVDSSPETQTFSASGIASLAREWIDRGMSQTTTNAIKVSVVDVTPSSGSVGTGRGATWIGFAFPGIAHNSVKRSSAAQRGG